MISRYTLPEMGALWSDENRYATWLKVELAVCQVQAERGAIPADAVATILKKARFDAARIDELELTTRHDVIAFLTNLAEEVGPDSRFIHMGMTSSDLLDTSLALLCVEAGNQILGRMDRLIEVLRGLANKHKYTWQIGRTHGIHAEPISFGLKLALWGQEMGRDRARFALAVDDIAVGKLSGVVGTFAHLDLEVEEAVCEKLGLKPAPVSSQVVQRDRHAHYLTTLAVTGATLEKMALEVRHLQRTEVREVQEAFGKGQKGSSAMPHKKNPIVSEQICGLARLLRANAMAGLENVALWHERDISHSSVERIILPDSTILADYLLKKTTDMISGLLVFPEKMMANIHLTGGLIFSQKVLLTLIDAGVTREDAYAMVQRHALTVWEKGGSFQQALESDSEVASILSGENLAACFNFEPLTRGVDAIFNRLETDGISA